MTNQGDPKLINANEVHKLIITRGREKTQRFHSETSELNANTLYRKVYHEFWGLCMQKWNQYPISRFSLTP